MEHTHIIRRAAVTLTHEEAAAVANVLRAYASMQWDAARRTKHAAVREAGQAYGRAASDLEASIVRRMFVADETYPETEPAPETCWCGCGAAQPHQDAIEE